MSLDQNLADLESLFSSKSLSLLAKGDYKKVDYARRIISLSKDLSVRDVFEEAYDFLIRHDSKNEYLYKNHIVIRHLLGRHSLSTATVLSEFRVGKAKADCVILNGSATCYEIKTDRDSLARLPDQIMEYRKLFDEVYVVTGTRHLRKLEILLDNDIGILTLNRRGYFTEVRKATSLSENGVMLDLDLLMDSLRKEEYVDILTRLGVNLDGIPNGRLYSECRSLLQSYDLCDIRALYVDTLKKYRAVNREFIEAMPSSLKGAVTAYKFSKSEINKLKAIFNSE